jgi:hypothetical protein
MSQVPKYNKSTKFFTLDSLESNFFPLGKDILGPAFGIYLLFDGHIAYSM